MRKLTRILIAIVLLFILLFISSGYFLKQECHGSQCLLPEIKVIYDIMKNCGLEYQAEKSWEDYWKAPYETERDGGGDCEDLSIWLLRKLTNMGYDCWLVLGMDEVPNFHMWVRIKLKDGSYWDADLSLKYIKRGFVQGLFRPYDYMKLDEVKKKQAEYEQGE